ncbi:hypothetical protein B0H34DRAFT_723747, partial [Crassisporium funariophilum]
MRGLVPYPYDPTFDDSEPMDDEDRLHDPLGKGGFRGERSSFPWRGVLNVGVLVGLILALLCLFVFYPVLSFYRDLKRNELIALPLYWWIWICWGGGAHDTTTMDREDAVGLGATLTPWQMRRYCGFVKV